MNSGTWQVQVQSGMPRKSGNAQFAKLGIMLWRLTSRWPRWCSDLLVHQADYQPQDIPLARAERLEM